ncbi:hypothetical protein MED297_04674 [Reinekea sp. MED297]|uniref:Uncharacterized protein n=2 Tax=Reinekea TaxID=230494 RepID=A4BK00_9GAMM|nr:hypothetical protein MED297_04674 [Reinekea sp. MED297] [Reinekea blandensis MED297]
MDKWEPFELSEQEYIEVLTWWQSNHPGTSENKLNSECWDDWVQELLESA